jgi:photosystem II stability/assembly factor-like uncharacterized protein
MFDAATGWAATTDRLLRTTDGALHWRDVTPPAPPGVGQPHLDAFPLSPDAAWVVRGLIAGGPGAAQSLVSHTVDGGQTWHAITLPVFGVAQITFVDAMHGWMLADVDTADGEQGVDIFRTTDGGLTWAKIANAADRLASLPLRGRKTGLTFRDSAAGWAGLAGPIGPPPPAAGTSALFQTQDGGATWHPVPLALPAALAQYPWFYLAGVRPPTFFSPQAGVLPVVVGSQAVGGGVLSLVYVTHDGGATWNPTTSIPALMVATSMLDLSHWWIASEGSADDSLFSTADGGVQWTSLTPAPPFARVSALSFVSATWGFAIGGAGLLRTTDGGRTWTSLAAASPSV